MDHHCLFNEGQDKYMGAYRGDTQKFVAQPCPYIIFKHENIPIVVVERGVVDDSNIQSFVDYTDSKLYSTTRIFLSPPRQYLLNKNGKELSNIETPIPFTQETFNKIVKKLHFHKAFFDEERSARVTRLISGKIHSFYIESHSHRDFWFKIFISYDSSNRTTTSLVHNLCEPELDYLNRRLSDASLQKLTIHPLFVALLIFEYLTQIALLSTKKLFVESVRLKNRADLYTESRFKHLKDADLDFELATTIAIGGERTLYRWLERIHFAIEMGHKLKAWMSDINTDASSMPAEQRAEFHDAQQIISSKLEYLADSLNLILLRLDRALNHYKLNRSILEGRNTSLGLELTCQVAIESKRYSSAMKAIAVLTMVFLPATFIAALFAVPIFDWTVEDSRLGMKSRLWIYWAVTIPSTVLILICWRVWFLWEEQRLGFAELTNGKGDLTTWARTKAKRRQSGDIEKGKSHIA